MDPSKGEHEAFLQPSHQSDERVVEHASTFSRLWPYARILVEVVMLLCIFILSTSLSPVETIDSLRRTPVPKRE